MCYRSFLLFYYDSFQRDSFGPISSSLQFLLFFVLRNRQQRNRDAYTVDFRKTEERSCVQTSYNATYETRQTF